MQLTLRDSLPFTLMTIAYRDAVIEIPNVLIDTGSATTIVAADMVSAIDLVPSPQDTLYTIRGVGGAEVVFARHVDYLQVGERHIANFEIEVGGMDYGFDMHGILGMDFLLRTGALIKLRQMRVDFVD